MIEKPRAAWRREAERRAGANGGSLTREDAILGALCDGEPAGPARLSLALASGELIDRDYLAYWVDELGLAETCRGLLA